MMRIRKGREPNAWKEYPLSTPGATFASAPKGELRRALLSEQGYICCYCMRRIDEDTTRIEHRLSQHDHEDQQFNYRNLLAACDGGEGLEPERQHCDVHKKNIKITADPADPSRDIEKFLSYTASGTIHSEQEPLLRDLDKTLNLNLRRLKDARLDVLESFLRGFERKHQKSWPVEIMERELKKWAEIPPGGKLSPYAGIVVHYLRKRLHRAAAR